MKILIDAFGGDYAPDEIVRGARQAADEYGSEIVLIGSERRIRESAARLELSMDGLTVADAPDVLHMDDDPRSVLSHKSDSSMAVGLKLLAAGEGDAFLSAGSTGALVVGATYLIGRLDGIKRPALAVAIPHGKGGCYLLLDAGANVECRPEHLLQFGIMGSAYYEQVFGTAEPRVGLVNVGREETKGTPEIQKAYQLLSQEPSIRFCGNVEARELPSGGCDVAVTDGFVGNTILKLSEGLSTVLFGQVKEVFLSNRRTKLAGTMMLKQYRAMKAGYDYSEYGGTPLLGLAKPVIKAHGSSKARAIKNAVRKAELYAGNGVIDEIRTRLAGSREE